MSDVDSRACWTVGLWCGVPQRLIRERTKPLSEKGERMARAAVLESLAHASYLVEAAGETLALLSAWRREMSK